MLAPDVAMRSVKPDSTTRSVLAATFACAAVVAHLVAAKAARDALFLASFHVSLLPRMMMAGALVSLITALVVARVLERRSPARLLLVALFTSAALYACEWRLLETATRAIAVALYLHVSGLAGTLVAGLWSVVNERFDPHAAKPAVGRIALGGSFGGVLGGIAGWLVSGSRGVNQLITMLLCLNLAAMAAVVLLARSSRAHAAMKPVHEQPTRRVSALGALRESPYLRTLATLVGLGALTSALLDYVLSSRLVARLPDAAELAGFFALFHACVGLLAVLVQLVFTRSALERFGLAATIALLPLSVLVMGAGALAFKQLWSAVLLRGSEGLAQASVFRAAYELAYTPLPRAQKRPSKMLIDVGIDRVGTVVGAGLTLIVVTRWAAHADSALTVLAMAGALGALYCTSKLHRGYVDALASRLRRGTLALDERLVFDATTRRTLAETSSLNRQELLRAIERQRSEPPNTPPSAPPAESEPSPETVLVGPGVAGFEAAPGYVGLRLGTEGMADAEDHPRDDLVRALVELRSADAQRIRKVLALPISPELATHVVPLLGRDDVALDALRALREVAERITGALSDALSDPSQSVIVRRRIPRILERCPTSRGIRTLIDGLSDPELDVRRQSALALLRMQELEQSVKLPRERIIDALERELHEPRGALQDHQGTHPLDEQPHFGSDIPSSRVTREVEHVMTLLALVLQREHVQLAYHALYADDPAIRGTALEYLENVLPERVRSRVLGLVQASTAPAPRRTARRDRKALLEELQRSREHVMPASMRALRRTPQS